MLVILQLIFSTKKELHTIAYSLLEAVAQMGLTVGTITKFLVLKIVNVSIKQKIFLEDQDLAVFAKI